MHVIIQSSQLILDVMVKIKLYNAYDCVLCGLFQSETEETVLSI